MSNLAVHMMQRSYASTFLHLAKMKAFVPCDVSDARTEYKARIVEAVFDPLKVAEVNARFEAAGYHVPEDMQVIAVNEDESILLTGGINSVYFLRKGERHDGKFGTNIAFEDVIDLTGRFKIKNKRAEIDELVTKLYGGAK